MDLRKPQNRCKEEFEASFCTKYRNFVVSDEHLEDDLNIFGGEEFEIIPSSLDMFDVLVKTGVFKSKSQARSNWTKTDAYIEHGFSAFVAGKNRLCICVLKIV